MIDARILNPNISMSAQAPNLPQIMQQMQNLSASKSNQRISEGQEGRAQELFPLLQQQQQQSVDAGNMNMDATRRAQYMKSVADVKPIMDNYFKNGDIDGAMSFLSSRRQQLVSQGLPTETTDEAYQAISNGDFQSVQDGYNSAWQEVYGRSDLQNKSVSQREFEELTRLAENDPESTAGKAAAVKLRLTAPAGTSSAERIAQDTSLTEDVARSQSTISGRKSGAEVTAKGIAARNQGYIDTGIDAADAVSNLSRTLDLLKTVETGGFENVKLAASRLLGVTGADEAELSANMGKAILAQLKPIFGAAFTAQEGERLEKIEASFGKSTEGNIRLINNVLRTTERAARRGLSAAEAEGDTFTANEIKIILDNIGAEQQDSKPKPKFIIESVE